MIAVLSLLDMGGGVALPPESILDAPPIVLVDGVSYAVSHIGGGEVMAYPGTLITDSRPVIVGQFELHEILGAT